MMGLFMHDKEDLGLDYRLGVSRRFKAVGEAF